MAGPERHMPVILHAVAILLYALGGLALALLLGVSVIQRRWAVLPVLGSLEALFIAGGLTDLGRIAFSGTAHPGLLVAGQLASVAAALSILYLSLTWNGVSRIRAGGVILVLAASAVPALWAACAVSSALSAAACFRAAYKGQPAEHRRFYLIFGIALIPPMLAFALGRDSDAAALAYSGCVGIIFLAVLRQNLFGLLISRRVLFVIVLGAVSALYLLIMRRIADRIAESFEAFNSVVETALILAAAILWMPFLSWTARVLGRRTVLYTEFGKRVIDGAVSRLTMGDRAEFLATGIRRLLRVASVHISILGERPLGRTAGAGPPPAQPEVEAAEALLRAGPERLVHRLRESDPAWVRLFAAVPYNYVIPLQYEFKLAGLLWVDSRPRQYLDDFEPVLLDIARQTSHSLEACRQVEEKIRLERSLMAQQHLAALGNVAASIAHEVKNPLSSIRALTQLMSQDGTVQDKYGRDLGYIIAEIDRLNSSMRQLLTFAVRPPSPSPTWTSPSWPPVSSRACARRRLDIRWKCAPGSARGWWCIMPAARRSNRSSGTCC